MVLMHLIAKIDHNVPVLFADTAKLSPNMRRQQFSMAEHFGLTNISFVETRPATSEEQDLHSALQSTNLGSRCRYQCAESGRRVARDYYVLVTDRTEAAENARRPMSAVEVSRTGRMRINPLAGWSPEEVQSYIATYDLPTFLPLDGNSSANGSCLQKVRNNNERSAV